MAAVADLSKIPAFPPIAVRVMRLLTSDDASNRQICDLLRADPVFSAEILRCANTPLYGAPTPIRTLSHAISFMGRRRVRSLAMTLAMRRYVRSVLLFDELRAFWRWSLACALLGENLARLSGLPEDTVYCAALLHDIGTLALMTSHPDQYTDYVRMAESRLRQDPTFDILACQVSVFGLDRLQAGEQLASDWNFPGEFLAATGPLPEPSPDRPLDLLRAVQAASWFANTLGFGLLKAQPHRTYEQILASLPPALAVAMPPNPVACACQLEGRIHALDSRTVMLLEDAVPQSAPPRPGTRPETVRQSMAIKRADWLLCLMATALLSALFLGLTAYFRP